MADADAPPGARPLGENTQPDDDARKRKRAQASPRRRSGGRRRSAQTPRETLSPSAATALEAFVGLSPAEGNRRKTADVETVRALERALGPGTPGDDDRTWAGPPLVDDGADQTATEGELEALRQAVERKAQPRQSLAPPPKGTGARAYEELLGTRAELLGDVSLSPGVARTGLEFVSAAAHLPFRGQPEEEGSLLQRTPPSEDEFAVAARRRAEALALEADFAPRSPEVQARLKSCLSSSKKRRPTTPKDVTFAAGSSMLEFERSDPPSALKSRPTREVALDAERRASAPQRTTSPPPTSQRRHTIENSAALARWTIQHGDTRGPRPLTSPRRASGIFVDDDASDTSSADSDGAVAPPRRSWAQAMELTGDVGVKHTELSPVVEEASPSDRGTPQQTMPLEDHLGDLLALPLRNVSRPSETVQLEADLGAMLAAVRPTPQLADEADVTMEDAAEVDTLSLLAALGLDDAALAPAAQQLCASHFDADETGRRLGIALAAADLSGGDDDGALVAATLAARAEAQALQDATVKINEAADACRQRSATTLRTQGASVELAARVAPDVAQNVVAAAQVFGATVVLTAVADTAARTAHAFEAARLDVEQREKQVRDRTTVLKEREKAADLVDAQAERLRQDAEHADSSKRRSGSVGAARDWGASVAAKLAAGLEPWTPRFDGDACVLDFPHALYGTWLSVDVVEDGARLIGRRERVDDDKDLMLKALRRQRAHDACAAALFAAPATWLHPRASLIDEGFEIKGSLDDVGVLSLFASKLARFAKELFRLEHRCDVRGVAFGETDAVVDCRVASSVRPAGLRVEFRVRRGYPAAGFERASIIGGDGLVSIKLSAARGDAGAVLVNAAGKALAARGLSGACADGWLAGRSTPGSLLRALACVQGACDAPDGSAILQQE